MTLRDITKEIIRLVENETGIPVRITEDPALPVLASVRIARSGGLPAHLITYKQTPGETLDYDICFECGYLPRLFANPPEKRFDLTYTPKACEEIEKVMTSPDLDHGR